MSWIIIEHDRFSYFPIVPKGEGTKERPNNHQLRHSQGSFLGAIDEVSALLQHSLGPMTLM